VDQAVFADVQVAGSGAASPLIGAALCDVVLESVDAGKAAFFQGLNFVVDVPLLFIERLELSAAVVDDADG